MVFSKGGFPFKLYQKFEKYDFGMYGIAVEGDGVKKDAKGTRVRTPPSLSSPARNGVVAGIPLGDGANALYSIRWDDGSGDGMFTTSEVLVRAVVGQGVVSLRKDKERFKTWLAGALGMAYVIVYRFSVQDRNKHKDPRPGFILSDDDEERAEIIRNFGWDNVQDLKAIETVSTHERAWISDEAPLRDLREARSYLKMLWLNTFREGLLAETGKGFTSST